jgi:iron complex outermembrane receptor protein
MNDGRRRGRTLRGARSIAALSCFGLFGAWGLDARALDLASASDLDQLSLEELLNVEVTSVSRAPERLGDAPAPIYVISAEDIRRSAASNLPEALRLAPTLEVAQQNVANYAITARGFNSPQSGNKLLVLVDGRSVYTPVASTVFWETLNVALPDVERIEVVRGPGGTLWGANAVNGVINVISKSAADTQGALLHVGAGDRDRNATLRYGGDLGDGAAFRVYGLWFNRGESLERRRGDPTSDGARGLQGGFRLDAVSGPGEWTLQGDAYRNTMDLQDYRLTGGNLLARWNRPLSERSRVSVQAYYDRADRRYQVANDLLQTLDLQAQLNAAVARRHRLVAGGEFRAWRSEFQSLVGIGFQEPRADLSVGSAFIQDEIALAPAVALTLGLKLEHSSYSGLDYLPNARIAWRATPDNLFWSAISRAVRTPSRIDRELSALPFLAPAPDFEPEGLIAYEAGYRGQPLPSLTLSLSAFYNAYDDLRTTERQPGGGAVMLQNGLRGRTYGFEGWAKYSLTPSWRLSGGFTTLHKDFELKPGHQDLTGLQALGQDPSYQVSLRSEANLSPSVELDVALRRVGRVSPSAVPAYTEADARLGWRLSEQAELSLVGRNLLHESHLEVDNPATAPVTPIARSVYVSLGLAF